MGSLENLGKKADNIIGKAKDVAVKTTEKAKEKVDQGKEKIDLVMLRQKREMQKKRIIEKTLDILNNNINENKEKIKEKLIALYKSEEIDEIISVLAELSREIEKEKE